MIHGIHHIAIHTPDLSRMMQFYVGVLGFEEAAPVYEWADNPEIDATIGVEGSRAKTVMLRAGNCYIELFEYASPAARNAPPLRPNDHGYTHLALEVTDIEAEYARLSASGMLFARPDVMDGGAIKAVYGKDPDGNVIEIQQVSDEHPFAFRHLSPAGRARS